MKSVATKKSDDEDNRRIFLKLEDLRKDSSIITLFLEQMKDHLGQQCALLRVWVKVGRVPKSVKA